MVLGDRQRDYTCTVDQEKQGNDRHGAKNERSGDPPTPDLDLSVSAQSRRHGGEDDADRVESYTARGRSRRATNKHESQPEKERERVDECPVDRTKTRTPGRGA